MSKDNDAAKDTISEGNGFDMLLNLLNSDREVAGEIYEDMRLKLRKYFARKLYNQSVVDELTDESLERLVKNVVKKNRDKEIIENINSLLFGIAKNVFLEYTRKPKPEPLPPQPVPPLPSPDEDEMYQCLEKCLAQLNPKDRNLSLDYYDVNENEKNKDKRKILAEKCGKSSATLKVYMNRLREKIRNCVQNCLESNKYVTKMAV